MLHERGEQVLEEQWKQPLPEGIVIMGNDDDDDDTTVAQVTAPAPNPTSASNAASVETGDKVCLMPDDLDAMIELALQSPKTELQIALTKFVLQLEPNSKLILDAVLPESSTPSKTKIPPAPVTNLRMALNSEWIWYTSTTLVDVVVDAVGGYLEPLDAAIDSMASDGESVGDVVVSKLLDVAAYVPIPSFITTMMQTQSTNNMLYRHTL
jgi:hypothetical protein